MLVRSQRRNGVVSRPRNGRINNRRGRNKVASVTNVPQRLPHPRFTHTFRYFSSTTSGVPFSQNSILISVGSVAVTSTILRSLYSSFRIISVKAWSVPSTVVLSQPLTINWFGNQNGTGDNIGLNAVADMSINPSFPQYISSVPPPNSYPAWWHSGATTVDPGFMFEIANPAGCILDLTVELITFDNAIGGATITRAEAATIGATVGQVYYCPLDNLTNDFRPVGVVNIIDQI